MACMRRKLAKIIRGRGFCTSEMKFHVNILFELFLSTLSG